MDLQLNKTDTVEEIALKLLQAVLLPLMNSMVAQGRRDQAGELFQRLIYGLGRGRIEHVGAEYLEEMVAVLNDLDHDYFDGQTIQDNWNKSVQESQQNFFKAIDQLNEESNFTLVTGKPS